MANVQEIIKAKQRAMLPTRLLRGAEVLGNLWRSGVRCSGGWGSACSCSPRVDFCEAKRRWIDLYCELQGDEEASWIRFNGGAFDVILAMSVRQFEKTGVTALVLVPGTEIPIRIGQDGTVWQTIHDLGALDGTTDYDAALRAVLKIQQVMR